MVPFLLRNWLTILMRGAASILLGMIVFIGKASAMDTFALLFAAYALADGVLSIIAAWPDQAEGMPRLMLLKGSSAKKDWSVLWPRSLSPCGQEVKHNPYLTSLQPGHS